MADLSGFNALAPENQNNRCLPKGEYRCVMVDCKEKTTKDGTGRYLNSEFSILDGEHQNKKIFCKFNIWLDPSKEEAIRIAKAQLSELCRAINVPTPRDTSELCGKPVIVKLTIKSSDDYGDQNNVVGFKAAQLHQVTTPPPQQRPAAQQAATGGVW